MSSSKYRKDWPSSLSFKTAQQESWLVLIYSSKFSSRASLLKDLLVELLSNEKRKAALPQILSLNGRGQPQSFVTSLSPSFSLFLSFFYLLLLDLSFSTSCGMVFFSRSFSVSLFLSLSLLSALSLSLLFLSLSDSFSLH